MRMDATERFAAAVARPAGEMRLDVAAFCLAAHARPDLDVDDQCAELDGLAERCPAPTFDAMRRYLFETLGFRGNTRDYGDPENSFLDSVLRRRLGIPISLAVVMMEVGRRIGAPVHGVGMPGHFLVMDASRDGVWCDPFHGGALYDIEGCRRLFAARSRECPWVLAGAARADRPARDRGSHARQPRERTSGGGSDSCRVVVRAAHETSEPGARSTRTARGHPPRSAVTLELMSEPAGQVMAMFPLGTVLFPYALLPLHVFEARYRLMMHRVLQSDREFGVVLIERGSEVGGGDTRFDVATVARVVQAVELPDGGFALSTVGMRRIRVRRWLDDDPYPRAEVVAFDDNPGRVAGDRDARHDRASLAARERVIAVLTQVTELARVASIRVSGKRLCSTPTRSGLRTRRRRSRPSARSTHSGYWRRPARAIVSTCSRSCSPSVSSTCVPVFVSASDAAGSDGYPAAMTDQVDAEAARERLERERARVGELISELRSEGLDVEQSAQSGDIARFDANQEDQAAELNEREKDLAILEGLEADLAEIEAALARLDEGTYGIDENTGEPIDRARLDAMPTARTNVPPPGT